MIITNAYKIVYAYVEMMIVFFTEKYAQHWCSMLSDPKGVFSPCHSEIRPDTYQTVS